MATDADVAPGADVAPNLMGKEEASGPYPVGRTSLAVAAPLADAGGEGRDGADGTADRRRPEVMLWPDEIWPQDIGALAVLDGSSLFDADGRFRIEAVREAVAGRLHLVPRFRQLLYAPPRRLGGPLWVDAATLILASTSRRFRFRRQAMRLTAHS